MGSADHQDDSRDLGALTARVVRMLRMSHFTIENAFDPVLWFDAAGRVRRANRAAVRVLGLKPGDLGQLRAEELIESGAERFRPHGDHSPTRQFEASLRARDGAPIAVDVAITELEHEGEPFACAFLRDLGPLKQSEQALRDALGELEQLKNRLQQENVYLQDEILHERDFDEVVGTSEPLRAVLQAVAQVAATDATVLILGESGTGKELAARAIHTRSARKHRPLVKVNCAALPASLIESELFGHERGAFTGALARRVGRFELADKGTIFLDEIGDLPLELQAKLLRVLQEGEFERLGDPRTISVDVRVIAATNQDLQRAVDAGRFRADLFYRLNVFPLRLPPLRERGEDVRLLAQHFAVKYGKKLGKPIERIAQDTLAQLAAYRWPGNVRELQNVVERAVIVSRGPVLELDQPLSSAARTASPSRLGGSQGGDGGAGERGEATPRTLREVEIALIREALEATNWVVGGKRGAAARLDIPASTLRERIARYGLTRDG